MAFVQKTCEEFVDALASRAATPGGGGASALVGAVGIALGSMVGNLTLGKKKYAAVQDDIASLMERAQSLKEDLLTLIDRDAGAFAPLSRAYGLPAGTPKEQEEKARVLEPALREACEVPLSIMEKVCEAIDLLEEFAAKGSTLALSDAGVGAACCRAALLGASLNIFINTKSMRDRAAAEEFNVRAQEMIGTYGAKAEKVYADVQARLKT